MIKEYVKIFLFLSSYAPLFLILGIKNYFSIPLVIIMIALILISLLFLVYVTKKASKMSGDYKSIVDAKDKSHQYLEYIIAYIIPFLGFNPNNVADMIALIIVFIIIGILYIRSDLIYMNPVLNFLGYKMFKVTLAEGNLMVISKKVGVAK
ncbi:MAG: hypothetical protein KKE98_08365 [Nanoarchaeota archaeon]|nr:hypothetical protein [Nanoarchaeota archaeon]